MRLFFGIMLQADRTHATREIARFSTGFAMRGMESWHAVITSP